MISMIVAYANGRVIGQDGKIPWRLPDDLRYFKRMTSGHIVVMGRKTFEAIGRPLPQRRNVVLTSSTTFAVPGVEVVHSKDEVLALLQYPQTGPWKERSGASLCTPSSPEGVYQR